jgi:hypothetical protein
MIGYRFYIRDNNAETPTFLEVDEPKGWDGEEITLLRTATYEGMENVYGSEIRFYNYAFTGFDYIVEAYDRDSFDANVEFKVEIYCDGELVDTITGYLNFLTYQRQGNEIELKFEESSFFRKFKNRIDTVIDLSKTTGLDGGVLSSITEKTVLLHSKAILYESVGDNDTPEYDKTTFTYTFSDPLDPAPLSPPNQLVSFFGPFSSAQFDPCEEFFMEYFIQWGTSNIKADISLIEYFNIPNQAVCVTAGGGAPNANGIIKTTGSLVVRIPIDIAAWVWTYAYGGPITLCGCSGDQDFGLEHFDFQLKVKVGTVEQSQGLSSGDRVDCDDASFFGDLVGKNTFTTSEADMTQSLGYGSGNWDSKIRFIENTFEFTFDAVEGDEITWWIECNMSASYAGTGPTQAAIFCEAYIGPGSGIELEMVSVADPSECTGIMLYEALNRVAESITGQTDAIRSDYFGRPDSMPQSYGEYGCESLSILTSGKNLRNMLQDDLTLYPITTSFSELFQALNVHNNLGVRVEKDGTEYRLRIEPKEYFFQRTSIFTVNDPSSITEEIAKERLYNDFEVGYNQWEIEATNGIDEPNTKHFYALSTNNIKNKLPQTTNYIVGGYAIEATRRIQYLENPTTDTKYDDNKFIISLNRIEVTSDMYSDEEETYSVGTVSERDELFTSVENILSPETAYNLRFSPARAAINWYKSIAPALLKKADTSIKFTSGQGNTKMITELVEDCAVTSGPITEDQDISTSDTIFAGIDRIALYAPIWISFEYPLNYSEFVTIRDNSNQAITVVCGDRTYFGFVEEINYKPNLNGGVADFKLLVAYCYQGAFDDGFNMGFDISQC